MKKWIVIFFINGLSILSSAQVDTFSVNNMPGNYYLPEWPDSTAFVPYHTYENWAWGTRNLFIGAPFCSDTIINIHQVYHYNFWEIPFVRNFAVGQYADTSIRLAGVALFYPHRKADYLGNNYLIRDEWISRGFDMLKLQVLDTDMYILAEGLCPLADSVNKPVFVVNRNTDQMLEMLLPLGSHLYSKLFDVYEAFFPTPVPVTDSFYLAFHFEDTDTDGVFYSMAAPAIYEWIEYHNNIPTPYDFPKINWMAQGGYQYVYDPVSFEISYEAVPDDAWFTLEPCEENHGFAMIFPILAVDCEAPDSVVWAPMGGGNVRVSWEQDQWVSGWEVSYGPTGTLPGEGTVLQTATPSVMLGGITMDTDYVVYVRSLCTVRDTVWGEWSVGTPFTLRPQRIEAVEAADVTLQPNPASGAVLLTAEAALTGVEVYTAAGAPFLRLPATGSALRIDTSTWPSGAYLLDVSTARGTTTKRLVVTH